MTARLDADAMLAVEDARALARRYQHDVVDPEHLLLALLTRRDSVPLMIAGVSQPELLARLDARLAARSRSALYRDSARVIDPTLSPGVETTIRRAAALVFFRAIVVQELFAALLRDPAVALLVSEATIQSEEIDGILTLSRTVATRRRHDRVTVDHVLCVLLDANWFVAALRAVRADPEEVREHVESRLALEPITTTGRRAQRSHDVENAARLARATAANAGDEAAGARHLVFPLLRGPHVSHALVGAGVPLIPLLRHLSGAPTDDGEDAPDAEGDLEVVLHNDATTTMEFVVSVLERCFDISGPRATRLMLDVHSVGERRIARFAAQEARVRVARARAMAEAASMPLRISLRAFIEVPMRSS